MTAHVDSLALTRNVSNLQSLTRTCLQRTTRIVKIAKRNSNLDQERKQNYGAHDSLCLLV